MKGKSAELDRSTLNAKIFNEIQNFYILNYKSILYNEQKSILNNLLLMLQFSLRFAL